LEIRRPIEIGQWLQRRQSHPRAHTVSFVKNCPRHQLAVQIRQHDALLQFGPERKLRRCEFDPRISFQPPGDTGREQCHREQKNLSFHAPGVRARFASSQTAPVHALLAAVTRSLAPPTGGRRG
jgi:hypothetical protein